MSSLHNGYAFQSSKYCNDGNYYVITIANVQDGEMVLTKDTNRVKVLPSDMQAHQKLKKGDLLISLTGNVGRICVVDRENCLLNQRVGLLSITHSELINTEFLFYCLQTRRFQIQMINAGKGGAQPNIGKMDVLDFSFDYPSYKEQCVIASSIRSINKHISTLKSLIFKYEAIKKSTVNLLLKPKTGWHKIGLEHFELHRNNTCSRSLTSGISGKTRNIHYGDILVKFGEIVSLKHDHIDYLSEVGEVHSPKDYLQDGDIVMADTAEDETVGKVVEIQNVGNQKAVAGLHTFFLRPPTDFFARRWLGYWMNSKFYHDQLLPYMTGIKVLSLSKSSILNTEISYPSRVEQEQTVEVLQSIDNHITLLHTQAVKAQQLKQGMMSYFFG